MPGQWTSIETNFPTFTGEEPVKDQIQQLYNYMYILTEQLKYNLSNLNATNWNTTALKQLTADTSSEVAATIAKDLDQISNLYAQLNARVANLSNTVAGLLGRMTAAEESQSGLEERIDLAEYSLSEKGEIQQRIKRLETDVPLMEEKISGEDGLESKIAEAEAAVEDLQAENDETGQRLTSAEETIKKLASYVKAGEKSVTVGEAGKAVYLVGEIYINGVLYGQEQEETA